MRNIEALRNYFLGKDPQLEVVLSDNSLRLSGIEGKHYILRGELIKRLTDLKTAMEEADEALQGSIDDLNLWKDTTPFVLDSDLATALSNYYTKTQVDNLLSVIPRFSIEVVEQLPTQDISTTTIYLAPSEDPQTANSYDEFIYVNNSWEQIGSTAIDMSDYYTKEEVNAKTFINRLTQDVTIPENSELNPLLLSTGWWYTGEHVIYYGESVEPTIYNNNLFYFNAEAGDQWFYFLPPNLDDGWNQLGTYLWFDSTDHIWQYSGYGVVTTIDNHSTDMSIPTAGAVYSFVNSLIGTGGPIYNLGDFATAMSPNILTNYIGKVVHFNDVGNDGLAYLMYVVDATQANPIQLYPGGPNKGIAYASGTGWLPLSLPSSFFFEDKINKVTSISGSSTDAHYPSAKAVVDYAQSKIYTDLTADLYLTDGVEPSFQAGAYNLNGHGIYINNLRKNFGTPYVDFGVYIEDEGEPTEYKEYSITSHTPYSRYIAGCNSTDNYTWSYKQERYVVRDNVFTTGSNGLVPAPATTDVDKYLKSDGTWSTVQAGTTITYGTTDLTPGVSQLNEGEFYFVYE